VTAPASTPTIILDLSNLCRDGELLLSGMAADHGQLPRFEQAVAQSPYCDHSTYSVADRSLLGLVSPEGRRMLRELEQGGRLEFSSIADERILELAFGPQSRVDTLVASKDNFDDFRRSYPEIQGSTDRFIEWRKADDGDLVVLVRDMGVHDHQRLSRKEESAELKARRLRRDTVVRRARSTYFSCTNSDCLLARLWPDHIRELPRYDGDTDTFVCPGCEQPLTVGAPRKLAVQLVVYLDGAEQFRILLEEGQAVRVGRRDSTGCIGLGSRLPGDASHAVSRAHVAFTFDGRRVEVADLGSRNGTVLRSRVQERAEDRLQEGKFVRVSRQHTVALPAGITIELSGRTFGLSGHQPAADDDEGADDDRATRLATRR
jgi:hypothetical protein